jgi:hypothetical protein
MAKASGEKGFWGLVAKWSLLVGAIAATLGLAFLLWDRFGPGPEPETRRADLAELAVEAGLTFGQYLERIDEDPGGLDDETLAQRGAFLEFDVETTGLAGAGLRLKWELLHAATGEELGQEQRDTITPGRNEDTIAWHAFLPLPPGEVGPFQARIELLDEEGFSLARMRSEPFAVS